MGYTTKFSIGDYVWIVVTETLIEKCSECGCTKSKTSHEIPKKVKVSEINITSGIESYYFPSLPRTCTGNNVFATKQEVIRKIEEDRKRYEKSNN